MNTDVLLNFHRAAEGQGPPRLGPGGWEQSAAAWAPEEQSSSSSRWGCQGQSAPTGNFLPQGALSVSKSLSSRKEFLSVSHGAKTVQRWDEEKVVKGRSKQRIASCAHNYCAKLWPTGPRSSRQCCQKHSPEFWGVVQSAGAQLGVPAPCS